MSKKKVLILSADNILPYQPTILNVYDFLEKEFDVLILTFAPDYIKDQKKDTKRNVIYISRNETLVSILTFIDIGFNFFFKRIPGIKFRSFFFKALSAFYLNSNLKKQRYDEIIAVDSIALFLAQKRSEKVHLLSLELYFFDPFYKLCNLKKIKSVIIQNEYRYRRLFGVVNLTKFIIQNAPVFNENLVSNTSQREGLLFAGTIKTEFGVMDCLNFIEKHPQFHLTLKGGIVKQEEGLILNRCKPLVEKGAVDFDTNYLSTEEFIRFISNHRIGFCFYDWKMIQKSFNYQTAPSGKLFMYFAAGIPVIACNIIGFEFVKEFNAGVLIDNYDAETIYAAIQKIEAYYEDYAANAVKAAKHFSFDKKIIEFINFLRNN